MDIIIDNQQEYNLNNNQIQVLLTGTFGDGHISLNKSNTSCFSTSCIYEEYIDFKQNLLGNLKGSKNSGINQGYKQNIIYRIYSKADIRITKIKNLSIEDKLKLLNNLGLALWLYDDGSLHKKNYFFNLNTHSFNEEIHQEVLLPYFINMGLKPKVFKDKKRDGREFCYLYFGKHKGAFEIMNILKEFPVDCYKYKLWSSETIQKWSKLQVQLKSENKVISPRKFANIILGNSTL